MMIFFFEKPIKNLKKIRLASFFYNFQEENLIL